MSRPTNFHESLRGLLAFSSRDWSTEREDAWIYGIVWGWDADPEDLDDDEEAEDAMAEMAKRHGWDEGEVERLRGLHAQFVAAAPYSIESRRLEKRTPNTADCPDKKHDHRWRRRRPELTEGTDRYVSYPADERGVVSISEESLSQVLRLAGFTPEVDR